MELWGVALPDVSSSESTAEKIWFFKVPHTRVCDWTFWITDSMVEQLWGLHLGDRDGLQHVGKVKVQDLLDILGQYQVCGPLNKPRDPITVIRVGERVGILQVLGSALLQFDMSIC
jgi:hypothetical protein